MTPAATLLLLFGIVIGACRTPAPGRSQESKPVLRRQFDQAVAATPKEYGARRQKIVDQGETALEFLRNERKAGRTAQARALAGAMLVHIEHADEVARLEQFQPPPHTARLRNPTPARHRAWQDAYRDHPELAFEKVDKTSGEWSFLLQVVASGPDALERLLYFLPHYPQAALLIPEPELPAAAPHLVEFVAAAAPNAAGLPALVEALGRSGTPGEEARVLLRRLLDAPGSRALRLATIEALGALRDTESVPALFTNFRPSSEIADPTERAETAAALQRILGSAEYLRRLESMTASKTDHDRKTAAIALGWRVPRHHVAKHAELLATLVLDREEIALRALESLIWLTREISREQVFDGWDGFALPQATVDALIAALKRPESGVRREALNALYGLPAIAQIPRAVTEAVADRAKNDDEPMLRELAGQWLDRWNRPGSRR